MGWKLSTLSAAGCAFALCACAAGTETRRPSGSSGDSPGAGTPAGEAGGFSVDARWPKRLPNNWILGQVSGIAVDAEDHVWVLQRPGSLTEDEKGAALDPPPSKCCVPAPPVLEFDGEGNLLRAFGGPGKGYDWPSNEHGIHIDAKGFVWVSGNGDTDGQILRFTQDGKFVSQIGKPGPQTNSADTTRMGKPAGMELDPATNEIFVADGYQNRRIIVFDADTGAYKRHWGAYGKPPSDLEKVSLRRDRPPPDPLPQQFGNPVHCVRLAHDGLVYVCDRLNDRVQVFKRDGTFVKEFTIEPRTAGNGSVWDLALSRDPQQRFLYLADGRNNQILTLARDSGSVVATTGYSGRSAGAFHWVHDIAIDSRGNLYTGEVDTGKRVQKFLPSAPPTAVSRKP
jgi:DNA-binding beta-propeller fold protein YncE